MSVNILRVGGQGLRVTGRLWAAVLWSNAAVAFLSALIVALVPFQMQGNQAVAAVDPSDPAKMMNLAILTLGLLLFSVGVLVFLLGGTVGAIARALNNERVGLGDVWRLSRERFGRSLIWAVSFVGFCLGLGIVAVMILGFVCAAAQFPASAAKHLAEGGFVGTMTLAGLPILFSFIPAIQGGSRIGAAFQESRQFVWKHAAAVLLLLLTISFLGAVIWWVGVLGGKIVGALRAALGIAPNATAFIPNLVLGFLVWWPQAVLNVFIPAALYLYYKGAASSDGHA